MKRTIITIFVSLALFTLNAQDWTFINPNERYHFQHIDDEIPLNTIFVDSIGLEGTDSIYYLNRLFLTCDTCFIDNEYGGQDQYYLDKQPTFLQKQIQVITDSKKIVLNDPEEYTIYLPGSVNKEWWFDSEKTKYAELDTIIIEDIFGKQDSIAIISINGKESIKISKKFGLIEYFDYKLSGLQNQELGLCLPSWKEFYDFEVGDVFQFQKIYHLGGMDILLDYTDTIDFKLSVKDIVFYNDTIEITWIDKSILRKDQTVMSSGEISVNEIEWKQYITAAGLIDVYPSQKVLVRERHYSTPKYQLTDEGIRLIYNTFYSDLPDTDAIYLDDLVYKVASWIDDFAYVFERGKGNTRFRENSVDDIYEEVTLVGYVKGIDTTGIVIDDLVFDKISNRWNFIDHEENSFFQFADDSLPLDEVFVNESCFYGYKQEFLFNKHCLPCDTCVYQTVYDPSQNVFLGKSYLHAYDSCYIDINDEEDYRVYLPGSGVDEWWFNNDKTQRAKLKTLRAEEVFGEPDSICIIEVDGVEQIKVAKSAGLLKYFNYERSINALPRMEGFYDFEVGDEFQFEVFDTLSNGDVEKSFIKRRVKEVDKDQYNMVIRFNQYELSWMVGDSLNTISSRSIYPSLPLDYNHISNSKPKNIVELDEYQFGIPYFFIENDKVHLRLSSFKNDYPNTGRLYYNYVNNYYYMQDSKDPVSRVFAEGLGEILTHEADFNENTALYRHLIGYKKGDESEGIIFPDEIYVVGLEESKLKDISISPNPSSGQLSIDIGIERTASIEIFNLQGQLIESFIAESNQSNDLSHLKAGIYIIAVETKQGIQQAKWIKQ